MNKEELIQKLTFLMERIDDTTEKEKFAELDKLEQAREDLMLEEAAIKQRLSSDDNYIIHNFFSDKSKRFDLESKIEKLNNEHLVSLSSLLEYESRKLEIDKDISAATELLSETQQSLENISKEYRSLKNATEETDSEYRAKMNDYRDTIKWLESEIKSLNEEKEYNTKQINSVNERIKEIDSRSKRFGKLLANLDEKSGETIDNSKKQKDRERLLQISQMYEIIDNREKVISYNYQKEIKGLIEQIREGSISDSLILLKLSEIKNNLPVKNYDNYDLEKSSLEQEEANLLQAKLELEEKLADEVNYTPSIFAAEVMDEEIKDLEVSLANHESDIANVDLSIVRTENNVKNLENSILTYENEIAQLEKANDSIRLKLAISPNLSDKEVLGLTKTIEKNNKKIKNNKDEIDKIRKAIETSNLSIVLFKKQKKNLTSIYTKLQIKLEDKKATLSDRKTIDRVRMEEDKNKLNSIIAQLNAVHKQQELLDFDYEQEFDDMYKSLAVSPVVLDVEPKEIEEPFEEVEPEIEVEPEVISSPFETETKEEPEVVTSPAEAETKEETLEPPIVVPKFKQASEKIYNQIHNPEFIKKAKEFFSRVAVYGVAVALVVSLLKGCQVLNQKPNEEAPSIPLEDLDSKELEGSLETIIEDVVIPSAPIKEEVKEDLKVETKVETKEDTKENVEIKEELSGIPEVTDIPSIDSSTKEDITEKIETPIIEDIIEKPSFDEIDEPSFDEIDEPSFEEPIIKEDKKSKKEVTTTTPQESISYSPVYNDEGEIKEVIISDNRAIIDDPLPVYESMQRESEKFKEYLEDKGVEVKDAYDSSAVSSITYDGNDMETTYETSNTEAVTNLNDEIRNMYTEEGLGGDYDEKQADNDAILEELGRSR